jgi:hypothetical protein
MDQHVTIEEGIRFGESYVKELEIIKGPNERRHISGRTVDRGLFFNILVGKDGDLTTDIYFDSRHLALDRKKVLTINQHVHVAEYKKSVQGEFVFFFGDSSTINDAPDNIRVRLGKDDVNFPDVFTHEQTMELNGKGMKMWIPEDGPTLSDVTKVSDKLKKLDEDSFIAGKKYGFDFEEVLKVKPILREISMFEKEIRKAREFSIGVETMLANKTVKDMVEKVKEENKPIEEKERSRV